MRKLRLSLLILGLQVALPQSLAADGVNAGLVDQTVVPIVRGGAVPVVRQGDGRVLPGSNQVGRPGIAPDQVGGYDVNIAYDHVAVGMAIVAVLFLMTEWMDAR